MTCTGTTGSTSTTCDRYEGDDVVDATYVQRSKRIKNSWQYTCEECGTRPISYDIGERTFDSEPGTCYVESIPWRTRDDRDVPDDTRSTARYLLACPNGCFSTGYGQHTEESGQPERYRCEECGARTVTYRADDRPEPLEPGTNYVG